MDQKIQPLSMKIVYFGSSKFSLIILEALCSAGFTPQLIISQPDTKKGRGMRLSPTQVSLFAEKANITLKKPTSLKASEVKQKLSGLTPDLFVVADYGKILPLDILSIPNIASLGVHPSLLPRYRGAAPINWALLNGDEETGVTVFKMNEGLDCGDIILQKKIRIEIDDNFYTLHEKLAREGALVLIKAINLIRKPSCRLIPQDETIASLTPKLVKKDGKIKWGENAIKIHNLVRATLGWPSAYTFYANIMIKILETDISNVKTEEKPSAITSIDKDGICVSTGNGIVKLKRVKPEGKKEMSAYSFAMGYRIKIGDHFDDR